MENADLFDISANVLCDTYQVHDDKKARKRLATVLSFMGLQQRTEDLYNDLLTRHKTLESWRKEIHLIDAFTPDLPPNFDSDKVDELRRSLLVVKLEEMVKQIKKKPDFADHIQGKENSFERINEYFFFDKSEGYYQVPNTGVILNQKVQIEYERFPDDYRFFFAFVYRETSFPLEFLSYHFEKTFQRNLSAYKDFLYSVEKYYLELIGNGKRLWDKWIDEVPPLKSISKEAQAFKSLFVNERFYNHVIGRLSSDDNQWFDKEGNFVREGNDNPSAVCDLLRLLIDFDYFERRLGKKVRSQMSNYANDCFGVVVGEKSRTTTHIGKHYTPLSRLIEKSSRL